jgi:TatD DNase family protein
MLINIHTHRRTRQENQLEIVIEEDTIGIHPWNLGKMPHFNRAAEFCLMIGETGVDRSERHKATLPLQKIFLERHLEAAKIFQLPIVIHCVRAHSDLLKILKDRNYTGKILLHDFSGNMEQLSAYLKFDAYFSFRRKFEILRQAPIERIFLETDDQEQISLTEIYKQADINELQFEKNLLEFFSDSKDVRSTNVINYFRST